MKLSEPPTLRAWNPDDPQERNLVLAGWLRTYVDQSHGVERSVFFRMCEPLVRELLERSKVIVAHMPDSPSAIYGWMCWERDVLHYVCVKPRWQRLGIATWLLGDFFGMPVTYTHRTPSGMKLPVPATWNYAPMRRFVEAA